jgi:hypothetical protein
MKAGRPTGDASGEGLGAGENVETPGDAAVGDASTIGGPVGAVVAFGAGAQPASSAERARRTGPAERIIARRPVRSGFH